MFDDELYCGIHFLFTRTVKLFTVFYFYQNIFASIFIQEDFFIVIFS
jgi:hypothetical protein